LKLVVSIVAVALAGIVLAQSESQTNRSEDLLWKRLDARVAEAVEKFDGVMGVAILDLTDSRAILKNADHIFPTASSIKIAILLELYHQDQEARAGAQAKAKLDDVYNFDPKELVEFSQIMAGLTPGVTRVTNRDLAQFMVAVSDNTAANILIDRVGKDNVNATLRSLGPDENDVATQDDGLRRGPTRRGKCFHSSRNDAAVGSDLQRQVAEQGVKPAVDQTIIDVEGKLHSPRSASRRAGGQ
jgi:beta-lactamase class A